MNVTCANPGKLSAGKVKLLQKCHQSTPKRRVLAARNKPLHSGEKKRESWNSHYKTAEVAVCTGLSVSRGNFHSCGHLSESTAALFVLFCLGFRQITESYPVLSCGKKRGCDPIAAASCVFVFPCILLSWEEKALALQQPVGRRAWPEDCLSEPRMGCRDCVETWIRSSPPCPGCFPSFHSCFSQLLLSLHHPTAFILAQRTFYWRRQGQVRERDTQLPLLPA